MIFNVDLRITWKGLLAALLLLLGLWLVLPQQPAGAAVLLVTKIEDTDDGTCDADCSLREAVEVAVNGDVIRFSTDLINREIVLSGEEILIENSIRIEGLGPTRLAISGNDQSRIFTIDENANVEISGLKLHQGYVLVELVLGRPAEGGGAILNRGTLTLDQMLITDNRAVDGGGSGIGGGIHSQNATLTVNNSTISNNVVEDVLLAGVAGGCVGGGISSSGNLTLYNVTISGNEGRDAGGWCFGVGLNVEPDNQTAIDDILNLNFVTIANNRGIATTGEIRGAGISSAYQQRLAEITIRNTLIAGNDPLNCDEFVFADLESYNLDDDDSCSFEDSTNVVGQNALIGALQDNGGIVPTNALLQNSPAIDRIPANTNGCVAGQTTDARSAVRAGGDDRGGPACDIGAYEYASNQQPTAVNFLSMQGEESGLPLWVVGLVLLFLGVGLLLWKRNTGVPG